MANSKQPAFRVFAVNDREYTDKDGEVKKGWWTRIGSAFESSDGGLSVVLDALPVPTIYDGKVQTRIVLRPFAEEEEPPQPAKKAGKK